MDNKLNFRAGLTLKRAFLYGFLTFSAALLAQNDTTRNLELREATIKANTEQTMGLGRLSCIGYKFHVYWWSQWFSNCFC